ncbi:GNAT family N-acetyltransferase [Bowmanella yangjiangensis]|uniref:GNAT family N-acetyltransferase n=1 Tax=Bowmanella yangjiangensis TaxID=2811230 RepID=A0ABS3CVJ1_9ALTE|nr:GNAT family N-acetyltransferase [Bowmanella yangjiangensis]MBN7821132.1 GNAT family N-acetyltransferase [Bowmanella yangjiangensis]
MIRIRHSVKDDFAAIQAIYQQPGCYSGTLQLPFRSADYWQARLTQLPENSYSLVAEKEQKVVGQLFLSQCDHPRRRHVARLGMAVCESSQGQGIGKQLIRAALELANDWLAITRVELEVYTDNDAATGLYRSFDFEVEGTMKNYAFRQGQYVDAYMMARVS